MIRLKRKNNINESFMIQENIINYKLKQMIQENIINYKWKQM